jgi:TatD DNase family protein
MYASSEVDGASSESVSSSSNKFIDIGANLLDERFLEGVYRGTLRHEPDLDAVVERAVKTGLKRIILTAGTLEESRKAVEAVRAFRTSHPQIHWSCTVGVHPTRCQQEFVDSNDADANADADGAESSNRGDRVLNELLQVALDGMSDRCVAAVGEIGLDYDRLEFTPKDVQQRYLVRKLQVLAKPTRLPLFLHNRATHSDLHDILLQHQDCWNANTTRPGGVVHSFDDSWDLAQQFMGLGLMIGINGCSLKTAENLEVVRKLPLDRVLLETDCPYCEIRPTHAGFRHVTTSFPTKAEKKFEQGFAVKNRQEPCHIVQVAEVVAGAKGLEVSDVAQACYENTLRVFFSNENGSDEHDDSMAVVKEENEPTSTLEVTEPS